MGAEPSNRLGIAPIERPVASSKGSDQARHKATYPALLGMAEAKRRADELHQEAIDSLTQWGEHAQPLKDLAGYIIHRQS